MALIPALIFGLLFFDRVTAVISKLSLFSKFDFQMFQNIAGVFFSTVDTFSVVKNFYIINIHVVNQANI